MTFKKFIQDTRFILSKLGYLSWEFLGEMANKTLQQEKTDRFKIYKESLNWKDIYNAGMSPVEAIQFILIKDYLSLEHIGLIQRRIKIVKDNLERSLKCL